MTLADVIEKPFYQVEIDAFKHGEPAGRAIVHSSYDREAALRACNYWDERINTYFVEIPGPPSDALGRALWRFDKLIEQLDTDTFLR
jgi:hypothetical protein